jgi:hypothetical protein
MLTLVAVENGAGQRKIEQKTVDYGDPRSSFRKAGNL